MNTIATWAIAHKTMIWPIVTALFLAVFHRHTPAEWVALGETQPRTQGAIRLLRAGGLDPRDVLIGAVQMVTGKAPMTDPRDAENAQLRARVAELSARVAELSAPRVPDGAPLVGEP